MKPQPSHRPLRRRKRSHLPRGLQPVQPRTRRLHVERLEDRRLLAIGLDSALTLEALLSNLPTFVGPTPMPAETSSLGTAKAADGEIHGTVWSDYSGDGVRDATEPGMPGVTVFLDTNDNGLLNAGETTATTLPDDPATPGVDEAGSYQFTGLAAGNYAVMQVAPSVFQQTFPMTNSGLSSSIQVLKDGVGGVDGLYGANSVAVSPDGDYVYATGYDDKALVVFHRDVGTGQLTFGKCSRTGSVAWTGSAVPAG